MSKRNEAEALLLEQVLKLPCVAELEIPEDYLDSNGHMNMMYFTLVANLGWKEFFHELGLPRERMLADHRSTFALRQFISYFNELKVGDKVAVYGQLVDYDSKRVHFIFHIVNMSSHKLASSDERLIMYMDMNTRRSATFAPDVLTQMEQVKARYDALDVKPELSGAIKIGKS